jgi:hypothetical protein
VTWDPGRGLPGQRASSQVKTKVTTWEGQPRSAPRSGTGPNSATQVIQVTQVDLGPGQNQGHQDPDLGDRRISQVVTWVVDLGPRLGSLVVTLVLTWELGTLTWAVDLGDLVRILATWVTWVFYG